MMFITYICIFSDKLPSHIQTFGLLLILSRFIGLPRYSNQPIIPNVKLSSSFMTITMFQCQWTIGHDKFQWQCQLTLVYTYTSYRPAHVCFYFNLIQASAKKTLKNVILVILSFRSKKNWHFLGLKIKRNYFNGG